MTLSKQASNGGRALIRKWNTHPVTVMEEKTKLVLLKVTYRNWAWLSPKNQGPITNATPHRSVLAEHAAELGSQALRPAATAKAAFLISPIDRDRKGNLMLVALVGARSPCMWTQKVLTTFFRRFHALRSPQIFVKQCLWTNNNYLKGLCWTMSWFGWDILFWYPYDDNLQQRMEQTLWSTSVHKHHSWVPQRLLIGGPSCHCKQCSRKKKTTYNTHLNIFQYQQSSCNSLVQIKYTFKNMFYTIGFNYCLPDSKRRYKILCFLHSIPYDI